MVFFWSKRVGGGRAGRFRAAKNAALTRFYDGNVKISLRRDCALALSNTHGVMPMCVQHEDGNFTVSWMRNF